MKEEPEAAQYYRGALLTHVLPEDQVQKNVACNVRQVGAFKQHPTHVEFPQPRLTDGNNRP